tara:strand:+ start:1385 stop:1543 length:159 start_codon:yes stop_codon:yes gene_type:complete
MLLNPANPKLRKIFLAVMAICAVLMIAVGHYWAALLWVAVFLGNYLQYRTIK